MMKRWKGKRLLALALAVSALLSACVPGGIYANEAVLAFQTRCRHSVDSVHSSLILLALRGFLRFESRLSLFKTS